MYLIKGALLVKRNFEFKDVSVTCFGQVYHLQGAHNSRL